MRWTWELGPGGSACRGRSAGPEPAYVELANEAEALVAQSAEETPPTKDLWLSI